MRLVKHEGDDDCVEHQHLRSAFGSDPFGQKVERVVRFLGTPQYILGQSIVVVLWIIANAVLLALRWDPYPFILLNLAFASQAAYAAPLILLAQARQADRDALRTDDDKAHREDLAKRQLKEIHFNTDEMTDIRRLQERLSVLAEEIHNYVRSPHIRTDLSPVIESLTRIEKGLFEPSANVGTPTMSLVEVPPPIDDDPQPVRPSPMVGETKPARPRRPRKPKEPK